MYQLSEEAYSLYKIWIFPAHSPPSLHYYNYQLCFHKTNSQPDYSPPTSDQTADNHFKNAHESPTSCPQKVKDCSSRTHPLPTGRILSQHQNQNGNHCPQKRKTLRRLSIFQSRLLYLPGNLRGASQNCKLSSQIAIDCSCGIKSTRSVIAVYPYREICLESNCVMRSNK